MAFVTMLVGLLIAIASLAVHFIKSTYSYWKRLEIPHDKPTFPHGNFKGTIKSPHFRDIIFDYYNKYKGAGPFVGMYFFITPAVLVLDLDLVKDVLIKDFHNFVDRGLYSNERDDPLSSNLVTLEGEKWKTLRSKISLSFTSGKMKFMLPRIVSIGDELVKVLSELVENDPVVEMTDVVGRFTTDLIVTCFFGIDCNSLKDPNVEFRVVGSQSLAKTRHSRLVEALMRRFPELARKLRMRLVHEDIHQFFMRVIGEIVEYREKNSVKHNDFMGLLIDIKNSGTGMTVDQIAAQSFDFFAAGFEIPALTLGFALFELAINQDIQNKLRAEVNLQFEKHDGQLLYESMTEMLYMDKVIKETHRKYSVIPLVMRKCQNDYKTTNQNFVIPKGVMVLIPAHSFQNDPDIYPDPERFEPERFSKEEIQKRHPMAWLPFGDGPRKCIGLRLGNMQVSVGLALLLRNFRFQYSEKTPNPIEIDINNPLVASKGGIYLKVEKIEP